MSPFRTRCEDPRVTASPPPMSRRLSAPRWFNLRFVVGMVIVVAPIFIGAHVLASADRYATVYVARQPLVPGEQITADDLAVGRVRFVGQGSRYVAAGRVPIGYFVTRYVAPGELLPLLALSSEPQEEGGERLVTVPVGTGHAPTSLQRGDLVDVYLSHKGQAGETPEPSSLVIGAVPVDSVTSSGALASNGTLSIVLVVPGDRVTAAVKAIETGTVDIVKVPTVPEPDGSPRVAS